MTEQGSVHRPARRLTAGGSESLDEIVAEERAVALVYNGISHAVMMATPCDLEDFARGFSLTERIVEKASEIYDIEVEDVQVGSGGRGIEVRLQIAAQRMAGLQERRRSLAGRTGCGLCGVDSLDAALRPVPAARVVGSVSRSAIERAMAALPGLQRINKMNGATHAAGWALADGTLVAVREDVGRHNALDKLGGALAVLGAAGAGGFVVVTSRCSYEMVQKAAALGAVAIAAVSAPTSLAIETAEQAGIALVAFVRDGRLTVYANAGRISREPRRMSGQRVFGVTGWKNAGKTTLVERLVAEFVRRGWRVSTVKHAHHDVDIDQPGRDSFRHRLAGATEVAVVGGRRYAIMREEAAPALADVLARLAPADLVLIEGYKREAHPKIEVRAAGAPSLAAEDSSIVAIAADARPAEVHLPWFRRDDIAAMADFIASRPF